MARRLGFAAHRAPRMERLRHPGARGDQWSPDDDAVRADSARVCGGDDWEPELARDGTTVYAVMTHYLGSTTCDPASGNPHATYIQVSSDSGRTFGPPHPVFTDPIGGVSYPSQADPSIAVDAGGNVYVAFLAYGVTKNRADVVVAKSTDHGATFPRIAKANGTGCRNCDHEKLVAAPSGLYLAYSQGPKHFIALSTDHDVSWTQSTVLRADLVAFAEGGRGGYIRQRLLQLGRLHYRQLQGRASHRALGLEDAPRDAHDDLLERGHSRSGPNCPFADCGYAYFSNQSDIAIDAAGTIYVTWGEGQVPTIKKSPPIVNLSRSRRRSDMEVDGPRRRQDGLGLCGFGLLRAVPDDRRRWRERGLHRVDGRPERQSPRPYNGFNVWLRTSTTGGASWTGPSRRISAYDPSQAQSHPAGFNFP